jgi:mRNA interferase YafQ
MKYTIKRSSKFKTDYKKLKNKQNFLNEFIFVAEKLANWEKLPEQYRDHSLEWKYRFHRECHILPDTLLIYEIVEEEIILLFVRVWSHSNLFK